MKMDDTAKEEKVDSKLTEKESFYGWKFRDSQAIREATRS